MLHTLPEDSRSQNLFNFSFLTTGECEMMEYISSVTLLQIMSNRVGIIWPPTSKNWSSPSTQHCCSSFKSFFISRNHKNWGYHFLIAHKQNPHTEINQFDVTAKIFSQPSIELCVASVTVQSGKHNFTGRTRDLPGLFNIHVSSDHRSYCESTEMRKVFHLYYGAMNQSLRQQMCQFLATGANVVGLYSVQNSGCKIILREPT